MARRKPVEVRFFSTKSGAWPVRKFIRALPEADRKTIGFDLWTVQLVWPDCSLPLVKPLGEGLYEIRSTLAGSRRICRVIFTHYSGNLILLHAFIKTTQKTPASDLKLAKKRNAELRRK